MLHSRLALDWLSIASHLSHHHSNQTPVSSRLLGNKALFCLRNGPLLPICCTLPTSNTDQVRASRPRTSQTHCACTAWLRVSPAPARFLLWFLEVNGPLARPASCSSLSNVGCALSSRCCFCM